MTKKNCLLLTVCCWLLLSSTGLAAPPRVVVSIKPIHSLVAGVMQGIAAPQLLVRGGASPHGNALRPSAARVLAQADLIVWVGPALESFLEKPLASLGRGTEQLELMSALAGQLLPLREGGSWEEHLHEPAEHRPGEAETAGNPHLWLSPVLAQQIVARVQTALVALDPERAARYQQNAQRLQQRLAQLEQTLRQQLAPVRQVPYLVFHDAYQYFEAAFGLSPIGSITINPERKPGVRRLLQMRAKIKQVQARCVFSEPQFEPKLVATIIEGTGARTGQLDPIGVDLPAGPDSYFLLLTRLAENLLAGLR